MISNLRLSLAIALLLSICVAQAQSTNPADPASPTDPSALYLKVRVNSPLKFSKLKPGDQVSGNLLQDVYQGGIDLFPASTSVSLTVDRLERRRRAPNDHWPWVIKAFSPRHERWPVFHVASVTKADGTQVPLEVSLISANREVEIAPKRKRQSGSTNAELLHRQKTRRDVGPIVTLTANAHAGTNPNADLTVPESLTVPSGTEAKVILLRDISASKNHASDSFKARLVEPVFLDSKVLLPEGTLFDGTVVKSQAPRTLSRSGSIMLRFTNMTLPGATGAPITASVAGALIDQHSHTVIDPEGRMHGDRPGKAWMVVNIGSAAGIAKVADDGTQLVIEALISTATDVSTAGTARIVSSCASAIYFLTRHGRDVVLPKYTQMKIVFDRPALVSNQAVLPVAGN